MPTTRRDLSRLGLMDALDLASLIEVEAFQRYTEIAKRIGEPRAVRAVAAACAANPLALAIPCHRVVRSDGALSGYRWGVERKRALLARERGAA